jgi:hypothetical protein
MDIEAAVHPAPCVTVLTLQGEVFHQHAYSPPSFVNKVILLQEQQGCLIFPE